jgi:hypothetical protein
MIMNNTHVRGMALQLRSESLPMRLRLVARTCYRKRRQEWKLDPLASGIQCDVDANYIIALHYWNRKPRRH